MELNRRNSLLYVCCLVFYILVLIYCMLPVNRHGMFLQLNRCSKQQMLQLVVQ